MLQKILHQITYGYKQLINKKYMFKTGDAVQHKRHTFIIDKIKQMKIPRHKNTFILIKNGYSEIDSWQPAPKIAINCKEQAEYDILINELKNRYQWECNKKDLNNWEEHQEETCISIYPNIEFGCTEYYKQEKFKIVSVTKFLKNYKK